MTCSSCAVICMPWLPCQSRRVPSWCRPEFSICRRRLAYFRREDFGQSCSTIELASRTFAEWTRTSFLQWFPWPHQVLLRFRLCLRGQSTCPYYLLFWIAPHYYCFFPLVHHLAHYTQLIRFEYGFSQAHSFASVYIYILKRLARC